MLTKNEFIWIYISFSESKCKSLSSCPYIYELDGRHDLGFWRPDLESGRPDLGIVDVENETRPDKRLSKSHAGVQGQ